MIRPYLADLSHQVEFFNDLMIRGTAEEEKKVRTWALEAEAKIDYAGRVSRPQPIILSTFNNPTASYVSGNQIPPTVSTRFWHIPIDIHPSITGFGRTLLLEELIREYMDQED